MATYQLNYTIPAGGTTQSVNVQATITASLVDPNNPNGPYAISNITGTRTIGGNVVETITGPDTNTSTNDTANNYFYPNNNAFGGANTGYFDFNGISYFINPPTQSANGGGVSSSGVVSFYRSNGAPNSGSDYYAEDDAGTGIIEPNPQQGASITVTPLVVCYASGTLIRTVRGEIAVEALNVGDLAITASGKARPIRWLGHRTIDCRAQPLPRDYWPIRVAAHAFGEGLPANDLFLSPGHSVQVEVMDEVLIPINKLVNGATIVRHPVDEVTYWHVELDSHDVLIANGLPAESFLDCGNRIGLVEREGEYDRLAGPHTPDDFCRPYIDGGPVVGAVRERLALRAAALGWTTTRVTDMHLMVDGVRVDADVVGNIARFVFPAAATHVALASAVYVPSDHSDVIDHRRLGVSVHRLEIEDGLSDRVQLSLDDERLAGGWHRGEVEAGSFHRFTDGYLALPPSLWAACRGQVLLRVHHDPRGPSRWLAPASDAANVVPLRSPS